MCFFSFGDCRKSGIVASLSSEAAGLLRDVFKPSSGALVFKTSLHRRGKAFALYSLMLARSSPEVFFTLLRTPLPRASKKTRDRDRHCSVSLHNVSLRLAERNRFAPFYAGVYTLQWLHFLVTATGFPQSQKRTLSLLTELLQSLRLHFVTQATSADPAHTFEGCCFRTLLRLSVPEPERPSSLASTFITSGSCRA